jgi:ketosteroid isomerase-like protein
MMTTAGSGGRQETVLADELGIRNLVSCYADAVNRRDLQLWRSTWAPHAEWHIAGKGLAGREAICQYWEAAMGGFEGVIQMVAQGTVAISGDQAEGVWTIWEVGLRGGAGSLVVGSYADRYAKVASGWSFNARAFTVCYRGALPAGTFSPFPLRDGIV